MMRRKLTIFTTIFAFLIIILVNISNTVEAKSLNKQIISKISQSDQRDTFSKESNNNFKDKVSNWFPGFLLFQILKGILAFIIILLVLLDIIEP